MKELRGDHRGAGRRVAIVAGRYHESLTEKLVDGALACLDKHGVAKTDVSVVWVPGAFEIPLVARKLAASSRFDAVICLGVVIRGDTAHFELVANEAARGIADVNRETGVPCIFEVLATDDVAQAESRAGGMHGNKGWEAAEAALEMASITAALSGHEVRNT